jgi:hypothetical protein
MRGRWIILGLVVLVSFAAVHTLRAVGEPADKGKPELLALRKAKVDIAKEALQHIDEYRQKGIEDDDALEWQGAWEKRLFEADLAATDDNAARVAAASKFVEASRLYVERSRKLFEAGRLKYTKLLLAKYQLADAECRLTELKPR